MLLVFLLAVRVAVRSAVSAVRIIICMTTQTARTCTRPTTIIHPTGKSSTVRTLVQEWSALSIAPSTLRRVNGWGLPGKRVANLDEVLIRAGFGLEATNSVGDQYLFKLVIRAANDELATRIVLQRLLPPLISIAARRGKLARGGFDEALTDTVAQAWIQIRTYPIDKRPIKIASNLVRDSEYFAFVRDSRLKQLAVAWGGDVIDMIPTPETQIWVHVHSACCNNLQMEKVFDQLQTTQVSTSALCTAGEAQLSASCVNKCSVLAKFCTTQT
jgi:hypothetical protein